MDSREIWPPGIIDAGAWSAGEINRVSILAEREVSCFFFLRFLAMVPLDRLWVWSVKNLINVIRTLLLFFFFSFFLTVSRVGYVCLGIIYKWISFGGDDEMGLDRSMKILKLNIILNFNSFEINRTFPSDFYTNYYNIIIIIFVQYKYKYILKVEIKNKNYYQFFLFYKSEILNLIDCYILEL